MNCRASAARVVASIIRNEGSLASLIPLYQDKVADKDRALYQDLCYGALRWYPKIDALLKQLLSKPLKAKDSDIQALLAIGIYQLTETRIPDHAALNETVAATKVLQKGWSKALVNGVLRNFQRQQADLTERLASNPQFKTAHPHWLLDIWSTAFPDQITQIVSGNNQRPPMTLRVNSRQIRREDYLQQLQEAGITAQPTIYSPFGITLSEPTDIAAIPGFAEGLVSVQDEAAQLAAWLMAPKPGDHILDACCAPGGKTCHLLELTDNQAHVQALDINSDRLNRVRENLDRLSLSASLLAANATDTESWWDQRPFDHILLDAPCSATGVIRRHPDIKILRRPEDAAKLATLQLAMLKALWPLLKGGGVLLYATCSLLPQENDQVVEAFLQQTPNARLMPIAGDWGISTPVGRQLLPQTGGHDGFYYAKLHKPAIE